MAEYRLFLMLNTDSTKQTSNVMNTKIKPILWFHMHERAGQYEEVHAFSDFANWLVPDKLLVGRYPYVEPSRCKSYEDGEKKLQQILKAGVTTFISLQVRLATALFFVCQQVAS